MRPSQPSARELIALLAIWLTALGLRFAGLDYQLPHTLETDASIVVQLAHAEGREDHAGSPHLGKYPTLIRHLAMAQGLIDPLPQGSDLPAAANMKEHMAAAAAPVLRVRRWVAFLGSLLVPFTWLCARRFLAPAGACLAAFWMATSLLHLQYSGQARPHAAAAACFMLALFAALRLAERGAQPASSSQAWSAWICAGLATGLALGSLQSGLAILIPMGLAALVRLRREGGTGRCFAACLLVLASIPCFYTFAFQGSSGRDAAQLVLRSGKLEQAGHILDLTAFEGGGLATLSSTFWRYEPWLCAALPLGLATLWLRKGKPAPRRGRSIKGSIPLWIALAFALPYATVLALYAHTYARFVLPLMPCLAILAAAALLPLWQRLARAKHHLPRLCTSVLFATCFLLWPLASAARLAYLRTQADTETLAADWIASRAAQGASFTLLPPLHLPLPHRSPEVHAGLQAPHQWLGYLRSLPPENRPAPAFDLRPRILPRGAHVARIAAKPIKFLREERTDYYALNASRDWLVVRPLNALRGAFLRAGELCVRIGPEDRGARAGEYALYYDDHQRRGDPRPFFWRLWRAKALGPVVEVHRFVRPERRGRAIEAGAEMRPRRETPPVAGEEPQHGAGTKSRKEPRNE